MFPGPNSMGFVWGGMGRALLQLMRFLVLYLLPILLPPLREASDNVVTVYAY